MLELAEGSCLGASDAGRKQMNSKQRLPCFSGGSAPRMLKVIGRFASPVWSEIKLRWKSLGLTEKPFHFHCESTPLTKGQRSLSLDFGYRKYVCAQGGNLFRGEWRSAYLFAVCQEHATCRDTHARRNSLHS